MNIQNTKNAITDVDVKNRVLCGYASTFNNTDLADDIILPGAFTKTIRERGPQGENLIPLVSQHDLKKPIGKPILLMEDSKGLYHETKMSNSSLSRDHLALIEEGILDSFSIGFDIPSPSVRDRKTGIRKISEILLLEYSLVTVAANPKAKMTQLKSIERAINNGRYESDETFHMLKSLQESLADDSEEFESDPWAELINKMQKSIEETKVKNFLDQVMMGLDKPSGKIYKDTSVNQMVNIANTIDPQKKNADKEFAEALIQLANSL